MEDPFYKIVFIGGFQTGKTAIVNALIRKRFINICEPTMGMAFQKMSVIWQQKKLTVEICDTSGAPRFHHFINDACKNAHLICLVIDATKSVKYQLESINTYKEASKRDTQHATPLLLIANHKNSIHHVLTEDDLRLVDVDPKDYVMLSAEQIADEASRNQASLLDTKFAERLEGINPLYLQYRAPQLKPHTSMLSSFSPLKWFNRFFQSQPTHSINTLSLHDTIDSLTQEEVRAILQSLHRHLKNGPLNNSKKPYDLGPFCFSGTNQGGFQIANQSFKCRDIFFESKAKYPENVMQWLSMTMVSMTNYNMHTEEDCKGTNLHHILKNLYDSTLSTQNSFSFNLFRTDSTKAFYKCLPKFIEDEINKAARSERSSAAPLLAVSPLIVNEQHI